MANNGTNTLNPELAAKAMPKHRLSISSIVIIRPNCDKIMLNYNTFTQSYDKHPIKAHAPSDQTHHHRRAERLHSFAAAPLQHQPSHSKHKRTQPSHQSSKHLSKNLWKDHGDKLSHHFVHQPKQLKHHSKQN